MSDQRKDQWIQQYEAAALGLLMEEYADAEGERLLQEYETATQQGEIEKMPEDVDAKCLKLIDQAYGKSHRKQLFSGIMKTCGKVAAVVLVFFGLVSATVLSVEAFRVPVLNFILKQTDKYTSISFNDTDDKTQERFREISDLTSSCIPSGYQLVNQPDATGNILQMRFQNDKEDLILITIRVSTTELVVDTENAEYIEMEISGHSAFYIQKDGPHIILHDENEQLIYEIYANGLSADEFWTLVYTCVHFGGMILFRLGGFNYEETNRPFIGSCNDSLHGAARCRYRS